MSGNPEEVLTPLTPPPDTLKELRRRYIDKARRNNALRAGQGHARFGASTATMASEWGVGVGLHFELLQWLRWGAFFLIICALPFLVVIGCSVFTDAEHRDDHTYGVKKYPGKLQSMTFAAIVDDTLDNGTLQYMNTELGKTWKGPMAKGDFLIWISLVDAGALLLAALGLVLLWRHLNAATAAMDAATLEAADYTVLVRGLPADADAAQVGAHFSRYGEVMDVVLVTDRLSDTLAHCGRAATLQQRRGMVLDAAGLREKGDHLQQLEQLDGKLAGLADKIRGVAERRQRVRAAFVTFNAEAERRACVATCPSGWLASLVQPRADRYLGRHRFRLVHASAPEDYRLENLSVPEWQLVGRELVVWSITLVAVLLCAAIITKLTDISNQESATINWEVKSVRIDAALALRSGPSADLPGLCSAELASNCSRELRGRFNSTVSVAYGQGLQWANATSRLLYERPVRTTLQYCSSGVGGARDAAARDEVDCAPLSACLPCLCLGLSSAVTSDGSPAGADAELTCDAYVNALDVRSWGVRLSISLVVAALNSAIKWALQGLVLVGRHWTHTARERSYALQCFLAMAVNTVAVLLLTNCNSLGELARASPNGGWIRFFVRYGSYDDFTAMWYENVGLSIFILMCINCASPLLNALSDELWQKALRCRVRHCLRWPLQADFDTAWARPVFTLEQRTADLLLNACLALMFGSGMPLLYLVLFVYLLVAELADRWALTKLCAGSPRYGKGLMKLVMGLLPWMLVAHCAFGLWMHTYFKVVAPDGGPGGDLSGVQAALVRTNARIASASGDLSSLQGSSAWQRITQPNGLALLLLFVLLSAWLLVGRYLLWKLLACLGRTAGDLCCPAAARGLRARLQRRGSGEGLNTAPYALALTQRELHGCATYRISHHPHYLHYFSASGLNRAVGVAALVAAAASGGANRRIYTRLATIRRRGRLAGGPATFCVLPAPVTDPHAPELLATEEAAKQALSAQERELAELAEAVAVEVRDESSHPTPAKKAGDEAGEGLGGTPTPPGAVRTPMPQPEMIRGPDVWELLQREEALAASMDTAAAEAQAAAEASRRASRHELHLGLLPPLVLTSPRPEGAEAEAPAGPGAEEAEAVLGAAATAACIVHVPAGRPGRPPLRLDLAVLPEEPGAAPVAAATSARTQPQAQAPGAASPPPPSSQSGVAWDAPRPIAWVSGARRHNGGGEVPSSAASHTSTATERHVVLQVVPQSRDEGADAVDGAERGSGGAA
ncbi:hypothetical protein HYH03_009324 [Edaphochlamys debaryana]|uniref:Uncharacterized protein n=1 Tax=Edaphochlamys debaryana TaxID=47281 RepID=A0A835XY76_9CHLO|nr:hypothetical protein HYH03_009324 [Edaphochlamys debaryana]|eukprot:KAG2492376.1 hypothetical protein HYH03_009324 [Edaphochlamys debaryana]